MITSFLLLLVGLVLQIIGAIFGAISWALPHQFFDAIEFGFAQLHYLDFLLPMSDLMAALGVYLTFIAFWYSIKIIMWTYHIVRHGQKTAPAKLHKQ